MVPAQGTLMQVAAADTLPPYDAVVASFTRDAALATQDGTPLTYAYRDATCSWWVHCETARGMRLALPLAMLKAQGASVCI